MVTAGGPVSPELTSFAPLDQNDLVDHFTGGFRYNVPLMEVPGPNGGYPIALTYASGITPDQDASWVGLGWTLSPGAIVRQMRGVPDDFDPAHDQITTTLDIEPQRTYGLGIAGNYEFFGLDTAVGTGLSFGINGYFDNYRGVGFSHTVGLSAQTKAQGTTAAVGLNLSEDTLEGARVGASASLSLSDAVRFGADVSFDATRGGLSSLSFSAQAHYQQAQFLISTGNLLNFLGYGKPAVLPGTGREMQGSNIKVSIKGGGEVYGNFFNGSMSGFYNFEAPRTQSKQTPAVGYLYLDKAITSANFTDPADKTDKTKGYALDFNRERDGPIYEQSPNLAMPVLTNDLFVVSGRDIVGTFRAYRNDTPVVFDPQQESDITGGAVGIDIGYGNVIKAGVTGDLNRSSTVIGRWHGGGVQQPAPSTDVDTLLGTLAKSFEDDPTGYRERSYFKFIGEPSVAPASESTGWSPIAPKLTGQFVGDNSVLAALQANGVVPPFFYAARDTDDQNKSIIVQPPAERVPRATLIQAFTAKDLREKAKALPDFGSNFASIDANPDLKKVRADNHIAGFRITGQNGTRYIYGIAVYNTRYEEHKFSVDRTTLCPGATQYCTIVKPPPPEPGEAALGAAYHYKFDGSEKLLEIKQLSPYPTSYLLTAIVGPDYIDSDGIPGPSDGDVGYWVKFNYVRASTDFQWRMPYTGANFVRGPDNGRYVIGTERLSDKASFSHGAREAWYLSSIETATHKALMCVDRNTRRDAISAVAAGQNATPDLNATPPPQRPWKLTSVRLYAKSPSLGRTIDPSTGCPDGKPLIEAHLDYENYNDAGLPHSSLTSNAPNAPAGKLTLKRVYFTHLDSARGRLSPYTFDYGAGDSAQNPDYGDGERDRWNNYQVPLAPPMPTTGVPPASPPLEDRLARSDQTASADQWAGAWSLRKVTGPTGRTIEIKYEAGDYAYVQDKPATRFFPLTSVNAGFASDTSAQADDTTGWPHTICPAIVGQDDPAVQLALKNLPLPLGPFGSPQLVQLGTCKPLGSPSPTPAPPSAAPRIHFPLECDAQGTCDTDISHYVDGKLKLSDGRLVGGDDNQIFFKIRVALRGDDDTGAPIKWQTVSGYANVRYAGIAAGNTIGWIELAPVHSNYPSASVPLDYHPFAHAAWQYLRLQQPELIHASGINSDPSGDPVQEAFNVLTLTDVLPELIQSLTGVYPGWLLRGWGQTIDLDNSWVRLKDPNGVKKGGGARVREIIVSDNWSVSTAGQESDHTTGYIYEYRLEDGQTSSGVAAYEPMVGGDENALRQAKSFVDQVLLSSDYNLFAELPIGEAHYPAPAVGYSRIVRRSRAAQADIDHRATRSHPTSAGPTVYEFYTARDFPVRSDETLISKQRLPFPQIIEIPLLGTITISSLTASQGYLTTINDMHGKPKRVANYQYTDRFEGSDYVLREDPIKETVYNYRLSGTVADTPCRSPDNPGFCTLIADPDPNAHPPVTIDKASAEATLAQQSDFVVDLRQNRTESFDGGINLNVDTFLIVYVAVPVPVPMPNFGYSLSETKTVVTSRVVHQSGILDGIAVREGSARITTKNDYYDPLTGGALLSESDNVYGDPVYSYQMPGRWTYPRMGPAYQDVGRVFDLSSGAFDSASTRLTIPATIIAACPEPPQAASAGPATPRCLPLGTEVGAGTNSGGMLLTLLGTNATTSMTTFAVDGDTAAPLDKVVVVRSGNRNLLTATTDKIRALNNPLEKRMAGPCGTKETLLHDVLDVTHATYRDDWSLDGATSSSTAGNDYAKGMLGIFRPRMSYVYRAERSQSPSVDLAKDGTFELALFGKDNVDEHNDHRPACGPWVATITHTQYSPAGFDIENFNALGIYSASQYGAGGTLPFAVASNAKRQEIGFEGFETNSTAQLGGASVRIGEGSIAFAETTTCLLVTRTGCADQRPVASIATDHAHTGKRSLRVDGDQTFDQPRLQLKTGRRYLLSGWVSLGAAGTAAADVPTFARTSNSSRVIGLQVSYQPAGGGPAQVLATFAPDGPIIEGWQRIEGMFDTSVVPGTDLVPGLAITFLNNAAGGSRIIDWLRQQPAWFDDIRIQPADASLEGFVYDLDTRRMTAKLDENNFATFYRYTPDGKVDLVRRETVRGVFAEREGRVHIQERP